MPAPRHGSSGEPGPARRAHTHPLHSHPDTYTNRAPSTRAHTHRGHAGTAAPLPHKGRRARGHTQPRAGTLAVPSPCRAPCGRPSAPPPSPRRAGVGCFPRPSRRAHLAQVRRGLRLPHTHLSSGASGSAVRAPPAASRSRAPRPAHLPEPGPGGSGEGVSERGRPPCPFLPRAQHCRHRPKFKRG